MSFFQVPKIIFNPDSKYFEMSNTAKIIYLLMIDRYKLSKYKHLNNNDDSFFDRKKQEYFIYFSIEELMHLTKIKSKTTLINAKNELLSFNLLKQTGNRKEVKYFLYPPSSDVGESEIFNINIKNDNVIEISNSKPLKLNINEISDNENMGLYIEKWQARRDCDVCRRLINLFKYSNYKDSISAEEFWYLRNTIQSYESKNNIVNFDAFVKSLRRDFSGQSKRGLISVKVGVDTELDKEYAFARMIKNSNRVNPDIDDDILQYDWMASR